MTHDQGIEQACGDRECRISHGQRGTGKNGALYEYVAPLCCTKGTASVYDVLDLVTGHLQGVFQSVQRKGGYPDLVRDESSLWVDIDNDKILAVLLI